MFVYFFVVGNMFGNGIFKYFCVFDCGDKVVFEFQIEMDGIQVNGVDMIEWNVDGKIIDFKVMVWFLKVIQMVYVVMGKMLVQMKENV